MLLTKFKPTRGYLILFVFLLLQPIQSTANDLGIKPSYVLGIWSNINLALGRMAEDYKSDEKWFAKFNQVTRKTYSQKTPKDVLEQLSIFRKELLPILKNHNIKTPELIADGGVVAPSVVFLNSGGIHDKLSHLLHQKMEPTEMMTMYYQDYGYKNKTPSDVFSSVMFAIDRLALLNKQYQ